VTANGDIGEAAAPLLLRASATCRSPTRRAARAECPYHRVSRKAGHRCGPGCGPRFREPESALDGHRPSLQAHLENDVVDLRQAHAAYEGATLDATGAIPLAVVSSSPTIVNGPSAGRPASLHATVAGITPAVLHGILDPTAIEDLSGVADLSVNVESPSTDLAKATGDLTLTRLDLQIAGLPVTQRVPTRIVAKDGFARIESWNWSGQGATLGVFGQVRLADRQAPSSPTATSTCGC